jgi:NTE family protein
MTDTTSEPGHKRRVVLACQGGASHTAFTAGVLTELLTDPRSDIRALSGTSGGALCALPAWYGLLNGDPQDGVDRLRALWDDITTRGLPAITVEATVIAALRLTGRLGVVFEPSPYLNPLEASRTFLRLLEKHVPFDEIRPDKIDASAPRLLVSAADVRTGEFRVFRSHEVNGYPADRITSRVILASAAVPTLFKAVPLNGALYWDGLFSQNPPIRELIDAGRVPRPDGAPGSPPDEVWVIQINPDGRAGEPKRSNDIRDRRNELTANISYQQEVFHIGHLNKLIQEEMLTKEALERYQLIKIRAITMSDEVAAGLDYESKLSRNPTLIHDLIAHGRERGRQFFNHLESPDANQKTALRNRNIWGQWITLVPPYNAERSTP